jgi:hypothetical protein
MPVRFARRDLLRMITGLSSTAILAACGSGTKPTATPGATARPTTAQAVTTAPAGTTAPAAATVTSPNPTPNSAATKIVSDVIEFNLRGPFKWNGGSVTMRLNAAFYDAGKAYFVRTDVSDSDYAKKEGLVYVPLIANALKAKQKAVAEIYLFDTGATGQLPVLSAVPGAPNFTSLFQLHRVTFTGAPILLDGAEKVIAAQKDGKVKIEQTPVVVNHPLVTWPKGELPVDTVVEKPLANGPLLSKPDLDKLRVVFKLHQCFPESRYIVTDTSLPPMATGMNVAASTGTAALLDAGATSKITVFGNGLSGPGAMGFQPAIFEVKAGQPNWSPEWDHWTAMWAEPSKAVLLKAQADIDARIKTGEIKLFHGTPDTNGQGFVVNCPAPILAPNDFVVS